MGIEWLIILAVIGGVVGGIIQGIKGKPKLSQNNQPQTPNKALSKSPKVDLDIEDESISRLFTFTKIAGVTYKNKFGISIQSILPQLEPKDSLLFIRNPDNEYDSNAIEIYWNGNNHIGHINRDFAADLAPKMDNGAVLGGFVMEVTGGDGLTYGCNIAIRLIE